MDIRGILKYAVGFPGGVSGKEPACQCRRHETRILSLYQKDPLEKGKATQYSGWRRERLPNILALDCIVHGVAKSQTRLSNFHFHSSIKKLK